MRILQYLADTVHAVREYPFGWIKSSVVCGYFSDDENGKYQQVFFDALLAHGFTRTYWQLVFPGQTAGLIRKIDPPQNEMDEIHVRFYEDGVIAAELEYGRFSVGHWREKRESSVCVLENILDTELSALSPIIQQGIRKQFAQREYTVPLSKLI